MSNEKTGSDAKLYLQNHAQFKTWNDIDWKITRNRVRKIQYRIFKESRLNNIQQVYKLQKWLTGTIWAKLLAVQQVTTFKKGRTSTKLDTNLFDTDKKKVELAKSIYLDSKSLPITRVLVEKGTRKKKQVFAISRLQATPTPLVDTAKQALALMALEPEWEARFEAGSYGFRPGRTCHDAIAKAFGGLSEGTPKWVFYADLRNCFDKIDHNTLLNKLNTFPLMKRQIRAWLKAGVMEEYANTIKESRGTISAEQFIVQTPVISPLLVNIALHGLENYLKDEIIEMSRKVYEGSDDRKKEKVAPLTVLRYADDFVVIHQDKEILLKCVSLMKLWLMKLGLFLHEEKSIVKDGRKGFDFLGFRFVQVRQKSEIYKIKIYPTKKSQSAMLQKVRFVLQKGKSLSSYELIERLRPIILGWANYYRYCECKAIFGKMSHLILQKLRGWVFRRDRKHGRSQVKKNYFPEKKRYLFQNREYKDKWILVGKRKDRKNKIQENFLPRISWVKSLKYVLVKGESTPFDRELSLYWTVRKIKDSSFPLLGTKLLQRQNGKCEICKTPFEFFDSNSWQLSKKSKSALHSLNKVCGRDEYQNLQLVHKSCDIGKTRKESISKASLDKNLQEPDEVKISRPDLKTSKSVNALV